MQSRPSGSDEPRRDPPRPQFEIGRPDKIHISLNRVMAGNLAAFIEASFQDEDPPALWALAMKLKKAAGGEGHIDFEDGDDSHAEGELARSA